MSPRPSHGLQPAADGPILGVVLAAGAGTRYGGPKIAAEQGRWLQAAVAALRDGGCDRVVVTMGALVVPAPAGSTALTVPDWHLGLGETVRAAAMYALQVGARGLLLTLVDTPDVAAPVVRRILDAVESQRQALVRASYAGRVGHPVYLGRDHLRDLADLASGDRGARDYLAAHRRRLRLVECGDLATGADHDRGT